MTLACTKAQTRVTTPQCSSEGDAAPKRKSEALVLLTPKRAASHLHLSKSSVYRLIKTGELKHSVVDGKIMVSLHQAMVFGINRILAK